MGWSSGSGLMHEVMKALDGRVSEDKVRQEIYEDLIPYWKGQDCDTLEELLGQDIAFDRAMKAHSGVED